MLIHLLIPSSSVDLQHSQQNESQRKWMAKKSTQTQTYSTKHLYWIIYSFTACWVLCIRALLCINRTKPPKATSRGICTLSRHSQFLLHSCTDNLSMPRHCPGPLRLAASAQEGLRWSIFKVRLGTLQGHIHRHLVSQWLAPVRWPTAVFSPSQYLYCLSQYILYISPSKIRYKSEATRSEQCCRMYSACEDILRLPKALNLHITE